MRRCDAVHRGQQQGDQLDEVGLAPRSVCRSLARQLRLASGERTCCRGTAGRRTAFLGQPDDMRAVCWNTTESSCKRRLGRGRSSARHRDWARRPRLFRRSACATSLGKCRGSRSPHSASAGRPSSGRRRCGRRRARATTSIRRRDSRSGWAGCLRVRRRPCRTHSARCRRSDLRPASWRPRAASRCARLQSKRSQPPGTRAPTQSPGAWRGL